MKTKSKVSVIGLGNIGKVVAANLVKGNREVIVASRQLNDAKALANDLGAKAKAAEISSAIGEADIVVLAIWFDGIKEFLKQYAAALKGKIVIDPSNPIAPDGKGGFKKIIDKDDSAGLILKGLVPTGASLVKAFGSLGAGSLASAAHKNPAAVLFYATDDARAITPMEELIKDSGFDSVNLGGLEKSIKMEVFGELHEFGALGKTVTREELGHLK